MSSATDIEFHHNIPSSHMGAGNNGNLSPLQSERHQLFHSIAGHPTPDMNLRRMLLSGLTRSGGKIYPATFVQEVLGQLRWENFDDIYEDSGFCIDQTTNGKAEVVNLERKKARVLTHRCNQLAFEHQLIRSSLSHITLGKLLPEEDISFHQRNMELFDVQTPSEAMKKFLTEKATDGDLAWVRPMQDDVRSALLETLQGVRYQKSTKTEKEKIIHVVNKFLAEDVLTHSIESSISYIDAVKTLSKYSDR
jgi:hypothetical protein